MVIATHLLFLVVYAAVFIAAVTFGPALMPAGRAADSLVSGALALAALSLVHAFGTGLYARVTAKRNMARVAQVRDSILREITVARAEAREIHSAIRESADREPKSKAMRDVVNEVKVLQGLIERLATDRARTAQPVAVAAGAGVARPAAPAVVEGLDDREVLEFVREGLESNRVDLYLQPVVTLPQRKRRYYECFSRIRDVDGDMVLPERYIPVAEREGLITVVDNMLLFRCVQLVRKTRTKNKNVGFFCNISPHTLADVVFFPEFIAFMSENQDLAANLYFEFSQPDIADLSPEAADNLHRLGRLGFRFSLDGVDRLDMNYPELSRRFFRFIKVDADTLLTHLRMLEDQDRLADFLAEVDRVAIDVIAEKIEDDSTLVELLDYKIDYGQGYLFGEPRLAKQI